MSKDINLIDVNRSFDYDADGLVLKREQHISDDYLSSLREAKTLQSEKPSGDMMRVASIPVVVVEKWIREGFNILDGTKTPAEIIKRLKAEDLDAFITTDKSV